MIVIMKSLMVFVFAYIRCQNSVIDNSLAMLIYLSPRLFVAVDRGQGRCVVTRAVSDAL
jgi:hypothetical protein